LNDGGDAERIRPWTLVVGVLASLVLAALFHPFLHWFNVGPADPLYIFKGYLAVVPLGCLLLLAVAWNPAVARLASRDLVPAGLRVRRREILVLAVFAFICAASLGGSGAGRVAPAVFAREGMSEHSTTAEKLDRMPAELAVPSRRELRDERDAVIEAHGRDAPEVGEIERRLALVEGFYDDAGEDGDAPGFWAEGGPFELVRAPLVRIALVACLAILLTVGLIAVVARQWNHNERLQNPLRQIVERAASPPRAMIWTALAIVGLWCYQIGASNGWHPLPHLPLGSGHPLASTKDLYRAFGMDPIPSGRWVYSGFWGVWRLYPSMIGLAFLLATDVGFSVWGGFFFGCVAFGILAGMGLPVDFYTDARLGGGSGGALLAMAVIVIWLGRRHYAHLFAAAIGAVRGSGDRCGVWGMRLTLVVSAVLLALIAHWGGSLLAALVALAMVVAYVLVVARVIAESGLITFGASTSAVQLTAALGFPLALPVPAVFAICWFLHLAMASTSTHLSGYLVQNTALLESAGRRPGRWLPGLAILACAVLVIGCVANLWSDWHIPETDLDRRLLGMRELDSRWQTRDRVTVLLGMDRKQVAIAGGALLVFAVALLRRFWTRCPLHPLGLVVAASWTLHMVWFSLFAGWLAKVLVARYGGIELFRRLRPVAIGLILGDALGYTLMVSMQVASRVGGADFVPWNGWP